MAGMGGPGLPRRRLPALPDVGNILELELGGVADTGVTVIGVAIVFYAVLFCVAALVAGAAR